MRFGLKLNPFEWASHDHKMADRKTEWANIRTVLNSAYGGQTCRFVLALGDYGMGKSFMLSHIYKAATDTHGVLAVRDVLTERPIATRSLLRTAPEFDIPSRIIANLGEGRLVELWNKAKNRKADHLEFKTVFDQLGAGNPAAFQFLVGERLTRDELSPLGARTPLRRPDDTIRSLFATLKLAHLAGYHSVLVLVDEFEAIMSKLGPKAAVSVLDALRAIFDEYGPIRTQAAKLVFVFGVSAQAWDKVGDLERNMVSKTGGGGISPFVERILPSDKIILNPFTLKDTLELVEARLSEVRDDGTKEELYPFTRDSLEFVYTVSKEKPRVILQLCYMLLEKASEQKGISQISKTFAEETLREYNIAPVTEASTAQ